MDIPAGSLAVVVESLPAEDYMDIVAVVIDWDIVVGNQIPGKMVASTCLPFFKQKINSILNSLIQIQFFIKF